jgi:putative hydrolase of the HAD superfamily
MKYRYIFFDLDRTLWDYEANSRETLLNLFYQYHLHNRVEPERFLAEFNRHNEVLWEQYRDGEVTKETLRYERMRRTFTAFGITDNQLADSFSDVFISNLPLQKQLFPDAKEVLEYLHRKYNLYILSNGFKETQLAKIEHSGLSPYFRHIFTSDELGTTKPGREFFHLAVSFLNARKEQCLMVGDDPIADITGAADYGIDQVFFNPDRIPHAMKPTHEIHALAQLKDLL